MRCLQQIAHVKWQDHIPNTEVLEICKISGIEAFLISAQLCRTGHVIRMSENRLLKQAFYSQLEHGTRSHGGQRKRYKDMLKHNLKAYSIDRKELETLAEDRSSWHAMCKASVQHFESVRVAELKKKRSLRKAGGRLTVGGFTCVTCGRICASRISLYSHRRTHPHHPGVTRDPSC